MSTAPGLDPRDHLAAVKAAITSHLGPWVAYSFGEVPGDPDHPDEDQRDPELLPPMYALVAVDRRYAPSPRGGHASRSSWRVWVRSVGTTVDEALWVQAHVYEGLDGALLTVSGHATTPLEHESSTTPEPDGGRLSALSQFIYSL